jgi:hypothetical protein
MHPFCNTLTVGHMVKAEEGETAQDQKITRRVRTGVEPGMDGFFQKMMKILLLG